MPVSVDVDFGSIESAASEMIVRFGGQIARVESVPIAFGLKALLIHFVMDEKIGSTESLETEISKLEGVNSVEVIDVRRAVG